MMHFRCGTFLSPIVTGQEDFDTGLGTLPTALWLTTAGTDTPGVIEDAARIACGATDGTNQWTTCAGVLGGGALVTDGDDVMDGQSTDTKILRIIDHTGLILAEAEFVSFNVDGTVTLDWTTVDVDNIVVGFKAWDQVDAQAGLPLVSEGDTVIPTTFEPKVGLGSNSTDANDGAFAMGWGINDAPATIVTPAGVEGGAEYAVRVDISDDFVTEMNTDSAWTFEQAGVVGETSGLFAAFTSNSFTIRISSTTITVNNEPVGYLVIGGGGNWFGVGYLIGNDVPWVANGLYPLGAVIANMEVGAVSTHETAYYGAWDPNDSQWSAISYLEEDTGAGNNFAVTGRALYDDVFVAALNTISTVRGTQELTFVSGTHTPTKTETGTIDDKVALYFVTQNPEAPGEKFQAWLVGAR